MILYRSGLSFRIDISGVHDELTKAAFAEHRARQGKGDIARTIHQETLAYKRWWAERQPEVRWAGAESTGAYVVDVSHIYWREKCFVLTFELAADASRFALLFLGLDQTGCEGVIAPGGFEVGKP